MNHKSGSAASAATTKAPAFATSQALQHDPHRSERSQATFLRGGIVILRCTLLNTVLCLSAGTVSASDNPLLDMIASSVIKKYQGSTCEQLWQQRNAPKSAEAKEFLQLLEKNPSLRTEFIDEVAAPVVNKMFECGLVP
jgi:hypothetical protein